MDTLALQNQITNSHCNISDNEEAERLAQEGWGWGELPQEKQPVSYEEAKTIVKEKQRRRWLQQHLDVDTRGSFCQVSIGDLVITVQLRTGLSRLRHHLFKKFCIELEESSAPLWYITHDDGSLPAGLSESPEPEGRNLACCHIGEGEDLQPCGEPPACCGICLSYSERMTKKKKWVLELQSSSIMSVLCRLNGHRLLVSPLQVEIH